MINAVYRGARVIGVARNSFRSQLAQDLGAEIVLDPDKDDVVAEVLERTGGLGASKSVETSGQSRYMDLLMQATRRLGDLAFVGESGDYTIQISDGMIRNGLHLHGIWHWSLGDAPDMLKMISEVGDSLDKVITHHFPLSQIEDAWRLQMSGMCGKVMVHPHD